MKVGPNPITSAIIKRGNLDTNKWGKRPCQTEAEIGVMHQRAKDCQGMPEARSNKEGSSSLALRESTVLRHPDFSETNILTEHFMPHLVVSHNDFIQAPQQPWKVVMEVQKAHVTCPRKGQYKVHITSVNRAGTPGTRNLCLLTPNPVIIPELLNQIFVLVFAFKNV